MLTQVLAILVSLLAASFCGWVPVWCRASIWFLLYAVGAVQFCVLFLPESQISNVASAAAETPTASSPNVKSVSPSPALPALRLLSHNSALLDSQTLDTPQADLHLELVSMQGNVKQTSNNDDPAAQFHKRRFASGEVASSEELDVLTELGTEPPGRRTLEDDPTSNDSLASAALASASAAFRSSSHSSSHSSTQAERHTAQPSATVGGAVPVAEALSRLDAPGPQVSSAQDSASAATPPVLAAVESNLTASGPGAPIARRSVESDKRTGAILTPGRLWSGSNAAKAANAPAVSLASFGIFRPHTEVIGSSSSNSQPANTNPEHVSGSSAAPAAMVTPAPAAVSTGAAAINSSSSNSSGPYEYVYVGATATAGGGGQVSSTAASNAATDDAGPGQRGTASAAFIPLGTEPGEEVYGGRLPCHRYCQGSGGTFQILCIDDDKVNQVIAAQMLKSQKWKVIQAMNGAKAIEYLERGATALPDLVLLDLALPGIDGFEVCSKLREMYPTSLLPIIVVSGKTGEDHVVEALRRGADDFVTKPYRRAELLERIKAHVRIRDALLNPAVTRRRVRAPTPPPHASAEDTGANGVQDALNGQAQQHDEHFSGGGLHGPPARAATVPMLAPSVDSTSPPAKVSNPRSQPQDDSLVLLGSEHLLGPATSAPPIIPVTTAAPAAGSGVQQHSQQQQQQPQPQQLSFMHHAQPAPPVRSATSNAMSSSSGMAIAAARGASLDQRTRIVHPSGASGTSNQSDRLVLRAPHGGLFAEPAPRDGSSSPQRFSHDTYLKGGSTSPPRSRGLGHSGVHFVSGWAGKPRIVDDDPPPPPPTGPPPQSVAARAIASARQPPGPSASFGGVPGERHKVPPKTSESFGGVTGQGSLAKKQEMASRHSSTGSVMLGTAPPTVPAALKAGRDSNTTADATAGEGLDSMSGSPSRQQAGRRSGSYGFGTAPKRSPSSPMSSAGTEQMQQALRGVATTGTVPLASSGPSQASQQLATAEQGGSRLGGRTSDPSSLAHAAVAHEPSDLSASEVADAPRLAGIEAKLGQLLSEVQGCTSLRRENDSLRTRLLDAHSLRAAAMAERDMWERVASELRSQLEAERRHARHLAARTQQQQPMMMLQPPPPYTTSRSTAPQLPHQLLGVSSPQQGQGQHSSDSGKQRDMSAATSLGGSNVPAGGSERNAAGPTAGAVLAMQLAALQQEAAHMRSELAAAAAAASAAELGSSYATPGPVVSGGRGQTDIGFTTPAHMPIPHAQAKVPAGAGSSRQLPPPMLQGQQLLQQMQHAAAGMGNGFGSVSLGEVADPTAATTAANLALSSTLYQHGSNQQSSATALSAINPAAGSSSSAQGGSAFSSNAKVARPASTAVPPTLTQPSSLAIALAGGATSAGRGVPASTLPAGPASQSTVGTAYYSLPATGGRSQPQPPPQQVQQLLALQQQQQQALAVQQASGHKGWGARPSPLNSAAAAAEALHSTSANSPSTNVDGAVSTDVPVYIAPSRFIATAAMAAGPSGSAAVPSHGAGAGPGERGRRSDSSHDSADRRMSLSSSPPRGRSSKVRRENALISFFKRSGSTLGIPIGGDSGNSHQGSATTSGAAVKATARDGGGAVNKDSSYGSSARLPRSTTAPGAGAIAKSKEAAESPRDATRTRTVSNLGGDSTAASTAVTIGPGGGATAVAAGGGGNGTWFALARDVGRVWGGERDRQQQPLMESTAAPAAVQSALEADESLLHDSVSELGI